MARLFRRAAFGARPAELERWTGAGYAATVDALVGGSEVYDRPTLPAVLPPSIERPTRDVSDALAQGEALPVVMPTLREAQAAWITEMAGGGAPLRERVVLLLHDHFATTLNYAQGWGMRAERSISPFEMLAQRDRFRTHALGRWDELCHAMLDDVALGLFLDHDLNHKGAARGNENLARELFELFLLGPGAFGERDVRAAARALTGYRLRTQALPNRHHHTLEFRPGLHDDGVKRVLGRRGRFEPHDVVDLALSRPAASRHLARRLATTFARSNPDRALVEKVAATLRRSRWSLQAALRVILLDDSVRRQRPGRLVRTPAELVVHTVRALDITDPKWAAGQAALMGQELLRPPNVGGWPQHEGWLSAGAAILRYDFAVGSVDRSHDWADAAGHAPTAVAAWAGRLGLGRLTTRTRGALRDYLERTAALPDSARRSGVLTLLLASPDFTLV